MFDKKDYKQTIKLRLSHTKKKPAHYLSGKEIEFKIFSSFVYLMLAHFYFRVLSSLNILLIYNREGFV